MREEPVNTPISIHRFASTGVVIFIILALLLLLYFKLEIKYKIGEYIVRGIWVIREKNPGSSVRLTLESTRFSHAVIHLQIGSKHPSKSIVDSLHPGDTIEFVRLEKHPFLAFRMADYVGLRLSDQEPIP